MRKGGKIRVGVGGWVFEPWRETFYPEDLPKARELEYAGQQFSVIEINATFYGPQKPSSFARWREQTPEDFIFSVKGPRNATQTRVLGDGIAAAERFVQGGLEELGPKLGPIVWQLAPHKRYDRGEVADYLDRLPRALAGTTLRHALDVRHASFMCEDFVTLARERGIAIVYADTDEYPSFSDLSADFVYARLMRSESGEPTGYPAAALQTWAGRAREWLDGGQPAGAPQVCSTAPAKHPRDVFLLVISGAKERNPAAAKALRALVD